MDPKPEPTRTGLPSPDPEATDTFGDPDHTDHPGLPELSAPDPDETVTPVPADEPVPTETVTVSASPQPADGSSSSSILTGVLPWTLVVVLLLAVGGMAAMAFGRRNRPAPPPVVVPVPVDPSTSPVVPELITLADLITTPAAQTQVLRALRTVGIEPVEAMVGAAFDPEVHEAVATRPAEDPSQTGTIAVVHRAGWRSPHGVVRPAGVEVWMADTTEGS